MPCNLVGGFLMRPYIVQYSAAHVEIDIEQATFM